MNPSAAGSESIRDARYFDQSTGFGYGGPRGGNPTSAPATRGSTATLPASPSGVYTPPSNVDPARLQGLESDLTSSANNYGAQAFAQHWNDLTKDLKTPSDIENFAAQHGVKRGNVQQTINDTNPAHYKLMNDDELLAAAKSRYRPTFEAGLKGISHSPAGGGVPSAPELGPTLSGQPITSPSDAEDFSPYSQTYNRLKSGMDPSQAPAIGRRLGINPYDVQTTQQETASRSAFADALPGQLAANTANTQGQASLAEGNAALAQAKASGYIDPETHSKAIDAERAKTSAMAVKAAQLEEQLKIANQRPAPTPAVPKQPAAPNPMVDNARKVSMLREIESMTASPEEKQAIKKAVGLDGFGAATPTNPPPTQPGALPGQPATATQPYNPTPAAVPPQQIGVGATAKDANGNRIRYNGKTWQHIQE